MGRKKNPGFYLYPDDILSSDDCRALSESAAGIYLFLLCRLSKPPTPGCYQISRYDHNRNSQRSLTQRCLATRDKQARLAYFAEILAENDLPWVKKKVLRGLKELYKNHIIIVEGDMLIQPRMARDNGFELPDVDNDGDPEEWKRVLREDAEREAADAPEAADGDQEDKGNLSTEKGTRKSTEISRAGETRASRAPTQREMEMEKENNNIVKGKSKGGVGENAPEADAGGGDDAPKRKNENKSPKADSGRVPSGSAAGGKRQPFTPPTQDEVTAYCTEKGYTFDPVRFFAYYEANGWVQGKGKPIKNWRACCTTWQQREKSGDFAPAGRGQPPRREGDPVAIKEAGDGTKYNDW